MCAHTLSSTRDTSNSFSVRHIIFYFLCQESSGKANSFVNAKSKSVDSRISLFTGNLLAFSHKTIMAPSLVTLYFQCSQIIFIKAHYFDQEGARVHFSLSISSPIVHVLLLKTYFINHYIIISTFPY